MPKKSMEDPAKALWRQKWRRFIKGHPLGSPNPRDWKVVCFPGQDALEVFEVYDRLSIPRENIIGIERDRNNYGRLKRKKLGIELYLGTDMDFFKEAGGRYDIVNLDYVGPLTHGYINTLQSIAGRQLLKEKSVLGTNFFGVRERDEIKKYYLSALISYTLEHSNLLGSIKHPDEFDGQSYENEFTGIKVRKEGSRYVVEESSLQR
ncbi:MAG: hypothetical protein HY367_00205, partial [Candidatus Aenigmarchaeota archaeon]|nr:hypothetical protein [Candidatus Aenigmarchaeota archaeon]